MICVGTYLTLHYITQAVFIFRNSLSVSIQVRMHAVKDREDVEKEEHLPCSRKSVIRGLQKALFVV
jgi:hypothetical protein